MANELLNLSAEDWDMLIDGVEQLKSKDMMGSVMGMMFESLMSPKKDASDEERLAWDEKQRLKKLDEQMKEDKKKEYIRKVELLKAKLILSRAQIMEGVK